MPLLETASEDNEPNVIGFADFYYDLEDIESRFDSTRFTESFSPDYSAEIIAKDVAMRQYMGDWATNRVYESLYFTFHRIGSAALHYDPDTVRWN